MFLQKIVDRGDNPVDNPKIYNVEGQNSVSPSLQQVVIQSTMHDNQKYVKILFLLQSSSVIVLSIQEIILFSSTKQNIQNFKHIRIVLV